jgi:nucleotide-binding universal stress UspA family protein
MQTIKHILFPTDFSDNAQNAFRYCLWLADQWGARIRLLHVVYPSYDALDLPVAAAKATEEKVEAARIVLQSFVDLGLTQVQTAYTFQHTPDIQADVEVGSPVGVIAQVARRDEADLIVMGTRSSHNLLEHIFGSVTTGVMEKAPCHVWVVPEEATFGMVDIVAYGADLTTADPYHIWKIGQVLECFGAVLHCVHARVGVEEEHEINLNELEEFFEQHAPTLQIRFHRYPGKSVTEALDSFSEEYGVDLLVMYAPHHSVLDRLLRPGFTKQVALSSKVPLWVLKDMPE